MQVQNSMKRRPCQEKNERIILSSESNRNDANISRKAQCHREIGQFVTMQVAYSRK